MAGRQHLSLRRLAGDGYRAAGCIVQIGHHGGALTDHLFSASQGIGVTGHHAQSVAHQRLRQHQLVRHRAGQIHTLRTPLVVQHPHAIEIVQSIEHLQGLPLKQVTSDLDRTGGQIIEVGNGQGGGAGHRFSLAPSIHITGPDRHVPTHIGLSQGVAITLGQRHLHAIAQPLIGNDTQTIEVGQGVECGQGLSLRGAAIDRHASRGRIIDVADGCGRSTDHLLGSSHLIDVVGLNRDLLAHIGLCQNVSVAQGPHNGHRISEPLIRQCAQAIGILQLAGHCQRLPLRKKAGDRQIARREVINVGDFISIAKPHRLSPQHIGTGRSNTNHLADIGLTGCQVQVIRCGASPREPAVVGQHLPLVGDGGGAIGIGEWIQQRGQTPALNGLARNAQLPHGRIVHIGHCQAVADKHRLPAEDIGGDGSHPNHLPHILLILGQRQAGARHQIRPAIRSLAQPLIACGRGSVGVGHPRKTGHQFAPLHGRPEHRQRAGGGIVQVCNERSGVGAQGFQRALPIDIPDLYGQRVAHIGLRQNMVIASGPRDGLSIAQPLVLQGAQAIEVLQGVHQAEGLALREDAVQGHVAGGCIVDVLNQRTAGAAHLLGGALTIHISGLDGEGMTHIGLREQEVIAGGPHDGLSIAQPLIADDTQPIDILQGVRGREGLALGERAAEGHMSCRQVIGVLHRRAQSTAHLLGRALTVHIAGLHRHLAAHIGLGQDIVVARGTQDRAAIAQPLVTHHPETVQILQGVRGREGLSLGQKACDGHDAGGCIVDVLYRHARSTAHLLGRSLTVHIAGLHGDEFAHLGLSEGQPIQ